MLRYIVILFELGYKCKFTVHSSPYNRVLAIFFRHTNKNYELITYNTRLEWGQESRQLYNGHFFICRNIFQQFTCIHQMFTLSIDATVWPTSSSGLVNAVQYCSIYCDIYFVQRGMTCVNTLSAQPDGLGLSSDNDWPFLSTTCSYFQLSQDALEIYYLHDIVFRVL